MKITVVAIILCVSAGLSGCATMGHDRRTEDARRVAELEELRSRVQRLEEHAEGQAASQEVVYRDMEALQARTKAEEQKISSRLSDVEVSLKAAEASRAQLRKDVVAELSAKMAGIMHSQGAQQQTQVGRRHVVQSGETVSEIASAYDVTIAAIVKANKLENAGKIRVGQSLFIPE